MNASKLTDWEWKGLSEGHNVADGHAHQDQNLEILEKTPKLFLMAEINKQKSIQQRFEQAFFKLNGQKSYIKLKPPLYQYACSLSIEVIANYLRLNDKSVALLHPTFDNLADILKRHNIPLFPIEENQLINPEKGLKNLKADAIFLVLPNNPTGTELSKKEFIAIINYCRKHKKLLILDHSFRFYSSYTTWDQYAVLIEKGIDFVVFEDTGKTWPTLELKIGITLTSDSLYSELSKITNDFLLNVSPFIFTLLTEYIHAEGEIKTYQTNIITNRKLLRESLKDLPLEIINPASNLSVEWLKLPAKWEAKIFCEWLSEYGVNVLPGTPFYWNNPKLGDSYIRLALQRPKDKLIKAIQCLKEATEAYINHEISSSIK